MSIARTMRFDWLAREQFGIALDQLPANYGAQRNAQHRMVACKCIGSQITEAERLPALLQSNAHRSRSKIQMGLSFSASAGHESFTAAPSEWSGKW
jgi:hypothetical protein